MIVISTRDFRANQTKFLNMAKGGEDVILKSRSSGSFKLTPVEEEDAVVKKRVEEEDAVVKKRDITEDIVAALRQVRDHLDGKIKLKSAESLIDELRNNTL